MRTPAALIRGVFHPDIDRPGSPRGARARKLIGFGNVVNVAINSAGSISLSRLHIHVFDDGMSVLVVFELHKTDSVRAWKKGNGLRAGIEISSIDLDDRNIGVGDISAYTFVRCEDSDFLPRKAWSVIGLKRL